MHNLYALYYSSSTVKRLYVGLHIHSKCVNPHPPPFSRPNEDGAGNYGVRPSVCLSVFPSVCPHFRFRTIYREHMGELLLYCIHISLMGRRCAFWGYAQNTCSFRHKQPRFWSNVLETHGGLLSYCTHTHYLRFVDVSFVVMTFYLHFYQPLSAKRALFS